MKTLQIHWLYRDFGGGESYFFNLCSALEERGNEVIVLGPKGKQHIHVQGRKEYFVEHSFGLRTGIRALHQIENIIASEAPDIIHLHETKGFLSPYIVNRIRKTRPVVQTVHIASFFCPTESKLLPQSKEFCDAAAGIKCFYRCARNGNDKKMMCLNLWKLQGTKKIDKIIVGSRFMRDITVKNGLPESKIELIPLFTDKNISKALPSDNNVILYVGRIEASKGILDFIKALSILKHDNWTAEVVGDGADIDNAKRLAHELKVSHKLQFLGSLSPDHVDESYRRACMVVMPSIFPESFGLVGVEAMAFGKPVIAYDAGGVREWLIHNETGLLVESGNVNKLLRSLEQLLSDNELRTEMGKRALEEVERNFRKENHIEKLMTAYDSVMMGRN
jgi:glycosyltransferase involved in cell wall biosynthesis